jgi:hypothetical protein
VTNAEPLWFTQLTVKCFHFSHEQNLDRSSIADPWIVRRSQSSLIRATALCGGIAGSTTYVTKYKLGTEIRAVPSTLIVGPHATVKWSRVLVPVTVPVTLTHRSCTYMPHVSCEQCCEHLRHGRDLMSDQTSGAWSTCSLDGLTAWKRPEPTKWAVVVILHILRTATGHEPSVRAPCTVETRYFRPKSGLSSPRAIFDHNGPFRRLGAFPGCKLI